MSRPDYDDMITDNNNRGKKATRATVLAVLFVILVVLIVLVIYLIANPGKKLDIAEKKEEVSVNEEKPSLFGFNTSSSDSVTVDGVAPETEPQLIIAEPLSAIEESPSEEGEMPLLIIGESNSFDVQKEEAEVPSQEAETVYTAEREAPSAPGETANVVAVDTPIIEETVEAETISTPSHEESTYEDTESIPENIEEPSIIEKEELLSSVSSLDVVESSSSVLDGDNLVITGQNGSAVHSLFSGTVVAAGKENGMKYIVVEDSDGNLVRYSGFERVTVKLKERVKKGEVLGSIGSSSFSRIILTYTPGETD